MSNTEYPFPWNHEVLLLDNTNISTDVLYILQNACYLFVSIYLFIWFVVLNAYLCIPIILYASGPYVKAVLLLRLSSNIILCPQPASAHVGFFSIFFFFQMHRKVTQMITLWEKLDNNYWKCASTGTSIESIEAGTPGFHCAYAFSRQMKRDGHENGRNFFKILICLNLRCMELTANSIFLAEIMSLNNKKLTQRKFVAQHAF